MEDKRVYANLDESSKKALHKKKFGFGWEDLPEILQTISGLHEDGKIESCREKEEVREFAIDLPILEMVVEEAKRIRREYSGDTETKGSLADAFNKALG